MEAKLVVLKLFLDTLNIPSSIDTVDDRKRVQKAVYLGQLSGVDLCYRFGWYVMGPYSAPLTRDYYQLAEELETEGAEIGGKQLRSEARAKLNPLRSLMIVPDHVPIDQEDWLELLASYDYLRRVSRYSHEAAVELLATQKTHVAKYVDEAVDTLRQHNLLRYQ